MHMNLNLQLELNLPTISADERRLLRGSIDKILSNDSELRELIKSIRVGVPRYVFPPATSPQKAGGLARAAALNAKQRKALAKRAAMARWGKRP